ncbi:hypothetical protein N619_29930 [Ectopseudomonas oleovorans]|nr:hypothetical protein N619_29930 [Pseudomonas oleovorans]
MWQRHQLVELDVTQIALERMDQAKQLAQPFRALWRLFQFDQQLLAAGKLLGGVEAEVFQQIAGQVAAMGLVHGRSPGRRRSSL